MLGKNQDQKVTENSSAIQAGGNVTVNNGLSFSEVRELCLLFLRDNFPALKEEAIKEAKSNVQEFAKKFEEKIIQNAEFITLENFKDPDVQAAINDAVQASARKGEKANTNILVDLLSERVSSTSNDFMDIVISEAVNVAPKLTKEQISYLSLIHFMTSCSSDINNLIHLEVLSKNALQACLAGFGISNSQKLHIQYAGACSIATMMQVNIYDGWMNKLYKGLGFTNLETFKSELAMLSPSTKLLLDEFDRDSKYGEVKLTSVGQAIAIANLSNSIGRMNYSTWLK